MATWALITVTYGGLVSHSGGYASRRLCEEARSVALTGLTIEENKEGGRGLRHCAEGQGRGMAERSPAKGSDGRGVEDLGRAGADWGQLFRLTAPLTRGYSMNGPAKLNGSGPLGPDVLSAEFRRGWWRLFRAGDIKTAVCVEDAP